MTLVFEPGETVVYKRTVYMTQWSPSKEKVIDYHSESKKEVTFVKLAAWCSAQIEVRTPCGVEKRVVKLESLEKK